MDVPEVIGFALGEASMLLKKAGISIRDIKIIVPPRDTSSYYDDSYRVIRLVAVKDKNVVLHVCKPL